MTTRNAPSPGSAAGLLGALLLATASHAHAGMTVIVLSDLAKARLEVISFFAVGYLLLAWAVKGLWNVLARTFRSLPVMPYRHALALMLVSGLLMYVVLTMISGARELMTPGAWQKQGIGYQLRDEPDGTPKAERLQAMEALKEKLWVFASSHEGAFLVSLFDPAFPRTHWAHPTAGGYYCYLPPTGSPAPRDVLVYEPANAGPRRIVLLTDGSIEQWKESDLQSTLAR